MRFAVCRRRLRADVASALDALAQTTRDICRKSKIAKNHCISSVFLIARELMNVNSNSRGCEIFCDAFGTSVKFSKRVIGLNPLRIKG